MMVDIRSSSAKSNQSEATTSRESTRRRWEVSPLRSEEVTSTTASPEREQDREQVPAASTPLSPSTSWESSSFSSSDWVTSSAESSTQRTPYNPDRRRQAARNLDVTTDSENCPLLRSSETTEEISIRDEPATNQGGRNVLDAGDTEACPRDEPLDARSATGVTSQPQLVAKEQIATAAVHSPDSFPPTPPTHHPVNPTLLGLSTQNTEPMIPTEPLVYQRIDERQTAGDTWGWPIAGTMNAATESPIHFSSLPFTSQPLNQSNNPVMAGLPTSIRQVTDPWTPYSDQMSVPQQNMSLVVTATVGSETARTDATGRTTYPDANFLYQGNPDSLPFNPTVVTASTSGTQTRSPTSSVDMSMLSNLSDFRAFPGVQTGLSNTTATVRLTGNNKHEAGSRLTESSGGVASVHNSQSYVPHWWPSYITVSFSRLMGEQSREMPLDLTTASTSRRPPGFPPHPPGFSPTPQWSPFSSSVYIPSAAPQLTAPRPPPGFTETPQLLPQEVSTVGTPLHVPQPVRPPPGFAVTRYTNAANIIHSQPPRIPAPNANQITMPSAASGCTIEHDVQPTVCPSTVSTAPHSLSPAPASDPAVTCCSSDTGDESTDSE